MRTLPGLPNRSVLVAVEGIDGAGKTTQVALLREALVRAGEDPVTSKEPTNGRWGRLIKDSATTGRLSPEEELAAFINDRTEHVESLVLPALRAERIVILDRYFYSSIAYQGARGVNTGDVKQIMESKFPVPDAVFVLDVEPSLGIHRIAHSRGETPNHFEDRINLATARNIFKEMREPFIYHIDGSMSREAVHERVLEGFINGPLKAKRCAKQYGCDNPIMCVYKIAGTCEWWRLAGTIREMSPMLRD